MIRIDAAALVGLRPLLSATAREQMPFAVSLAVNRLAQQFIRDARAEMRDSFSSPTAYTLNSLRQVTLATKARPVAEVDFKAAEGTGAGVGVTRTADKYLRYQAFGGQRRLKAFERALVRIGAMPDDHYAVPGPGAQFDRHGNVKPSQIVAILSYFRAFQEDGQGWRMNSTAATRARMARGGRLRLGYRYFVGRPGGRANALGIYQDVRIGPGVRELLPVFWYVRTARYEVRLDLPGTVSRTVRQHGSRIFNDALRSAIATARPPLR